MINTKDTKLTQEASVDQRLETLESLCQSHDWYYAYSDDHRVWKKGTLERDTIALHSALLREQGLGDAVDKIIAKYCH